MELTTWNLPVLALRGLTVFPHMTLTFDVERPISIAALERAMEADQDIFLVTQREIGVNAPEEKDLYTIGTVSHITQILRLGQNSLRVMVEGGRRARLKRLWQQTIWKLCWSWPGCTWKETEFARTTRRRRPYM